MAVAAVLAAPLTSQEVHPEELELKPKIDAAIQKGVDKLLKSQLRDGSWGVEHGHVGGQTGLCVYTLLKCGVAPNHPSIRNAFIYLDRLNPTHTYSLGCMMLAYGESASPAHVERVEELLRVLLGTQEGRGTWAYPHKQTDLSNTQYAALGLWAATKVGLKVPPGAWNKLIQGTLRHQESPRLVKFEIEPESGPGTSSGRRRTTTGKREVAGFGYHTGNKNNCTGTMTSAGISILKICEVGLGKRLGGRTRKKTASAIDAGLNWMTVNFSVTSDQRPGSKSGKWLLYYLYGMERVGGLCRIEQFGAHWWYLEGARLILGRQKKDGHWGKPFDTCFALLFLRRSTSIREYGPTTGGSQPSAGEMRDLYASGTEKDAIQLRGAGQNPLMVYISGFGPEVLAQHAQHGLRIMRVEYREGARNLGLIPGDPTRNWRPTDTFLQRCDHLALGDHEILARVVAVDPSIPPGETSETVTIGSLPMNVTIRAADESVQEAIASMQDDNVLQGVRMDATASSNPKHAAKAADGNIGTQWKAGAKDALPTLTLEFKKPVTARRLLLTQALQNRADLDNTGVVKTVEVGWNTTKKFEPIEMNPDPMAVTVFELPKAKKLHKLTIRVTERGGKPGKPVGFAEIVLGGKRK